MREIETHNSDIVRHCFRSLFTRALIHPRQPLLNPSLPAIPDDEGEISGARHDRAKFSPSFTNRKQNRPIRAVLVVEWLHVINERFGRA